MRALRSYECGFVTLCAPPARATQASHPGVGPYRPTSCFRMYLRFCCGVLTSASGAGVTTAGTGGGLTSGSSPMGIHRTPGHFRMNSLSRCWSAVSAELSCLSTIQVLRGTMTRWCAHDDQRKCYPSFSPHRLPRVLRAVPRPEGMLFCQNSTA